MLPGHILDLYCVRLLNTAPFCKNYTKLYFDAKHLEKGLNGRGCGGVKIMVPFFKKKYPFFIKKCPFWPISNAALNSRICPGCFFLFIYLFCNCKMYFLYHCNSCVRNKVFTYLLTHRRNVASLSLFYRYLLC